MSSNKDFSSCVVILGHFSSAVAQTRMGQAHIHCGPSSVGGNPRRSYRHRQEENASCGQQWYLYMTKDQFTVKSA